MNPCPSSPSFLSKHTPCAHCTPRPRQQWLEAKGPGRRGHGFPGASVAAWEVRDSPSGPGPLWGCERQWGTAPPACLTWAGDSGMEQDSLLRLSLGQRGSPWVGGPLTLEAAHCLLPPHVVEISPERGKAAQCRRALEPLPAEPPQLLHPVAVSG